MISEEVLMDMYVDREMTVSEIARKLDVEYKNIGYWLRTYRIVETRNHISVLKKELEDMYLNKKMTMPEIASELDVSSTTIRCWIRKHGIKIRSSSEVMRGKLHPNWKGGISLTLYCYKFNSSFKELIRMRDDNTCQLCDYVSGPDDKKLSVHHIHYDKPNCYPDVITLCNSCNAHVNHNRDYWEKHFEDLLRSRGLLMEV